MLINKNVVGSEWARARQVLQIGFNLDIGSLHSNNWSLPSTPDPLNIAIPLERLERRGMLLSTWYNLYTACNSFQNVINFTNTILGNLSLDLTAEEKAWFRWVRAQAIRHVLVLRPAANVYNRRLTVRVQPKTPLIIDETQQPALTNVSSRTSLTRDAGVGEILRTGDGIVYQLPTQ